MSSFFLENSQEVSGLGLWASPHILGKGFWRRKRLYVKLLDDLREVYLLLNFVVSLGLQNLILSLLYWHWGTWKVILSQVLLNWFQSLLILDVLEGTVKHSRRAVCIDGIHYLEETISWFQSFCKDFMSEDPSLLWLSAIEFLYSFRDIAVLKHFYFSSKKKFANLYCFSEEPVPKKPFW